MRHSRPIVLLSPPLSQVSGAVVTCNQRRSRCSVSAAAPHCWTTLTRLPNLALVPDPPWRPFDVSAYSSAFSASAIIVLTPTPMPIAAVYSDYNSPERLARLQLDDASRSGAEPCTTVRATMPPSDTWVMCLPVETWHLSR